MYEEIVRSTRLGRETLHTSTCTGSQLADDPLLFYVSWDPALLVVRPRASPTPYVSRHAPAAPFGHLLGLPCVSPAIPSYGAAPTPPTVSATQKMPVHPLSAAATFLRFMNASPESPESGLEEGAESVGEEEEKEPEENLE